jgi:hypothetical protein
MAVRSFETAVPAERIEAVCTRFARQVLDALAGRLDQGSLG